MLLLRRTQHPLLRRIRKSQPWKSRTRPSSANQKPYSTRTSLWKSWCGDCNRWLPPLRQLFGQRPGDRAQKQPPLQWCNSAKKHHQVLQPRPSGQLQQKTESTKTDTNQPPQPNQSCNSYLRPKGQQKQDPRKKQVSTKKSPNCNGRAFRKLEGHPRSPFHEIRDLQPPNPLQKERLKIFLRRIRLLLHLYIPFGDDDITYSS